MVGVDRDLFSVNAVRKVIRRLGNFVVGGHTAVVDHARFSDLHHWIVSGSIGGNRNLHHPAEDVLVGRWRKR